jgi:hypothetical protein
MKDIARTDVAVVDFRVRRRRYGARVWLVRHNEWFEIDGLFDYVWKCAQSGRRFEDVAIDAGCHFEWSLSEAIAGVSAAWATLHQHGLIDVSEAPLPEGRKV